MLFIPTKQYSSLLTTSLTIQQNIWEVITSTAFGHLLVAMDANLPRKLHNNVVCQVCKALVSRCATYVLITESKVCFQFRSHLSSWSRPPYLGLWSTLRAIYSFSMVFTLHKYVHTVHWKCLGACFPWCNYPFLVFFSKSCVYDFMNCTIPHGCYKMVFHVQKASLVKHRLIMMLVMNHDDVKNCTCMYLSRFHLLIHPKLLLFFGHSNCIYGGGNNNN